jgi:hypothetical protein
MSMLSERAEIVRDFLAKSIATLTGEDPLRPSYPMLYELARPRTHARVLKANWPMSASLAFEMVEHAERLKLSAWRDEAALHIAGGSADAESWAGYLSKPGRRIRTSRDNPLATRRLLGRRAYDEGPVGPRFRRVRACPGFDDHLQRALRESADEPTFILALGIDQISETFERATKIDEMNAAFYPCLNEFSGAAEWLLALAERLPGSPTVPRMWRPPVCDDLEALLAGVEALRDRDALARVATAAAHRVESLNRLDGGD